MNFEMNQTDSCKREECIVRESKANDKSTSPNGFVYMDMDVYVEEDESLDEADIKEEDDDEEEPEEKNSNSESNEIQFDSSLPFDSIENAEDDSIIECNSANDCENEEKEMPVPNPLENKNCSTGKKRYELRMRTCQRKEDHSIGFKLENYKSTRKKIAKKSKNCTKKSRLISFKCSSCKRNFSPYQLPDNSSKLNGIKYKSDELQYETCKKCLSLSFDHSRRSQTFEDDKERLESHIFNGEYTNYDEYTCDICKEVFTEKTTLRRHILGHVNDLHRRFENSRSDLEKNGGENELHPCHLCDKSFHKLNIHLRRRHGIVFESTKRHDNNGDVRTGSKCEKINGDDSGCGELVRNDSRKVEETDESVNESKYECDECGNKFVDLVEIRRCGKCNGKFSGGKDKDETCGKKKVEEEPPTCETCGKVFAKREYLKKHQYVHSNVLYKCKYCYCAFAKEKSYNRHVEKMNCSKRTRRIKMAEFNYRQCRICRIEYETEESLIGHFRESHSGEEPHRCFCCDACLPTFRDLQAHVHEHDVKKYTCNLCGKPYTSQEGFRKHRLKHKGGEFKCEFCHSEFLNENRFKLHGKTCKKNPATGSGSAEPAKRKDGKPKQSRQLHWESRIIMKRLRGDPKSAESGDTSVGTKENSVALTFFEEPENDATDERGWFDNYYRTEEDDAAFGLVENGKTKKDGEVDDCAGGMAEEKKKSQEANVTRQDLNEAGDAAAVAAANSSESSEQSESSSSGEESVEEDDLPLDYNPKKCRLCGITFEQEYELLHHFIKSHPKEQAHECPKCEIRSPLFAQLKEHMKAHGIGMGIYNCDNCSKKFRSERKMKCHNVRCKGANAAEESGKSFRRGQQCKKCGKTFHTKFGYRRHKQSCRAGNRNGRRSTKARDDRRTRENDSRTGNENVGLQKTKTEIDNRPSEGDGEKGANAIEEASKRKMAEVKDAYAGEPPLDSFPCRLCDKKFQYERGIVMHFKSSHPGQKPLVCRVCNMHLADKLKEHLKTHGIGEEFVCELCGKRFNQKFLSKIHEMWHQGIEYKCGNCKQKFLNKEKMDKHVGENRCSNRQSLMRLPCGICGKSYRSKFGLSKHHITHTPKELRPVKNRMNCEYCGKWFENNNGLQRHRRIHTGERPFCCRFCPKAFVQEGNCKAHERIHTGEPKPRKRKAPEQQQQQPPPPNPPQLVSLQQVSLSAQNDVAHILFPPSAAIPAPDSVSYPGQINVYVYETSDDSAVGIVH